VRFVAIQAAEQLCGHAPVGALRAVFIATSKKANSPLGLVPGFFRHGGLVNDMGGSVNADFPDLFRLRARGGGRTGNRHMGVMPQIARRANVPQFARLLRPGEIKSIVLPIPPR